MTAALSWPLQKALLARLNADAALTQLLGPGRIFDSPPHADEPSQMRPPYVALGEESVDAWFDQGGVGAVHDVSIFIFSDAHGFAEVKRAAGAISDALETQDMPLERGVMVRRQFLSAAASRDEAGARRRMKLRYRFVLEDI